MHLDMDAFFASVEQRANPALRGKPIAVIGSSGRTVVTTASYEARRFGVKTGMNKFEARRLCPDIIFVVGDNAKYVDASERVLAVLERFSPLVEPFSIDEAFVDLTGSTSLFGKVSDIAREIKRLIRDGLGLTCSVGLAPNKLLAKLASGMEKPDGLVVIKPVDVGRILEGLPVNELCGIGPATTEALKAMGIATCGPLGRADGRALRARFGVNGERLKLMGQGVDGSLVAGASGEREAKSIGHSTTLPRDVSDLNELRLVILKLSDMVAARARRYGLKGSRVSLTVRYSDFHTFSRRKSLATATFDAAIISAAATAILGDMKLEKPVRLVGVTLSELSEGGRQLGLFDDAGREALLFAMDRINDRYGDSAVTWGSLVEPDTDDEDNGVISPSWRPKGVRRVEF
jgi:DNA polymerase-4